MESKVRVILRAYHKIEHSKLFSGLL